MQAYPEHEELHTLTQLIGTTLPGVATVLLLRLRRLPALVACIGCLHWLLGCLVAWLHCLLGYFAAWLRLFGWASRFACKHSTHAHPRMQDDAIDQALAELKNTEGSDFDGDAVAMACRWLINNRQVGCLGDAGVLCYADGAWQLPSLLFLAETWLSNAFDLSHTPGTC